METKLQELYSLFLEYQELADLIPMDYPGSRMLPRLNKDLARLSIELLTINESQPQFEGGSQRRTAVATTPRIEAVNKP
ncbi:hypothetical protein QWI17_07360 [Gilvimarinus sp. SDUM040013]|uniref:Uncharacterized protein n=1 Tax=Gilvimarinus gilvus TaxID=3058038 RepID=A0ABU4S776_9GAMM|nr:hypothetical protein [Gilvimarinus sp. SDUM040013]MDO3385651.1 hypothetical protein [Gilvimarinus sp. SDUM040013]MDX6851559.1 hypothetical protein [Gilvimarinus sp. SDUM040013]